MNRLSASLGAALLVAAGSLGGAACGSSGPDTGGAGGSCQSTADCPGADTDCRKRTCEEGACGFADAPAGTAVAQQSLGDCKVTVCDGQGATTLEDDPSDTLDDNNPCTEDTCSGGAPLHTPLAAGTTCQAGDGKLCDGEGACVECIEAGDCTSGVCAQSKCVPPACTDAVKNGDESDVDCGGGTCAACPDGDACGVAADCQSGVCTTGVCQAPTCTDAVKNGTETGKDCGGSCDPCGPGEGCVVDGDCIGDQCSGAVCVPTCTDAVKNANETDVDCGGPTCAPCADQATCAVGADCQSGVCTSGVCQAPTCTDAVKNGDETGQDCGGTCGPCADGLGCVVAGDCQSGVCQSSVCAVPVCGDGVVNGADGCDDGAVLPGDGCDASCHVEPGYTCTGNPSVCVTTCGDGIKAGAEACDDGAALPGDGCDASCHVETGYACAGATPDVCGPICGDGLLIAGEACDDGAVLPGDGCDATCHVETGYGCTGAPSACVTTCGDGVKAASEGCDDGNTLPGDGCDATCHVEAGYECTGIQPSACATICGDGIKAGAEKCDDGGSAGGDGCDATCKVESYWKCAGQPSACARISILYAPATGDNATFRADVAAITGGPMTYVAATTTTPSLSALSAYDCVYTFPDQAYLDRVTFGNNLADYVDGGRVVVLGSFSTYTTGNALGGRIMTPGYSPVTSPAGTNRRVTSAYSGNGTSFLHNGVTSYASFFRDYLALQGSGVQDGTYADGEIAHAYRPDFRVVYSNGLGMSGYSGTGQWPLLIANACAAAYRN